MNIVKKTISVVLEEYDRFYMHLRPCKGLVVGKRGLIGDEAEHGMVIIFGSQSYRDLEFHDGYFTVDMRFSGSWESLIVPFNGVSSMFNDPANPEFMFNFNMPEKEETKEPEEEITVEKDPDSNLIKFNFNKNK